MRLAATSTEYVHVPVTAPAGVDLTGVTPRLAFLPQSTADNPEPEDWHAGTWVDGEALVLVGPDGGTELDVGHYWVWINIDPPGPENVVQRTPGGLTIY
ncbi:hypothetical protein [Streptomyces chumphonensis]|uniref:hypothetical protein n=1 Tax=Streptomyces chumphonensis TaxID=1214925 RepID=UPI003D7621A1